MDTLDDREGFENACHYFVLALKSLAASPEEACEMNGWFNTAFEIKHDVEAGPCLFNNVACPLTDEHKAAITSLVSALQAIPEDAWSFTQVRQESLTHMQHPGWLPAREMASRLLESLQPITDRNTRYFERASQKT
jgi:hypothetical protein